MVPKGEGADTRLIFHLSFPRNRNSVNSQTLKELCTVHYKYLDYAIALCVKVGRGCYIAKSDMKSTFRNVPIKHEHWCRLVLYAHHPVTNQKFYFADKCLPFGASISCSHFQHFSDSVAHIFKWKTGDDTNNYWDDFLFAALLKALCNGHVEIFLDLCKTINFSVALDKTNWGTQVFVFLGFLINMILQMVSIPETKCNKAIVHINSILAKRKVMVLQMQKITGLLNFFCRAIVPGRAFTRHFYAKLANPDLKQHYHLKVDSEMRRDLTMWLSFLSAPESVSRPFMDFSKLLIAEEMNFFTDASGAADKGFGCVFADHWTYGTWEPGFINLLKPSIE